MMGAHVASADRDVAGGGPDQTKSAFDDGRLPGSVRAEQADDLAGLEFEIHPLDRPDGGLLAAREDLDETSDAQNGPFR